MAKSDSKGKRPPLHSRPPPGEPMDVAWDEDTVPRFDYEEAGFERVTAIPELPPELFAKQIMEAHPPEEDEPPGSVRPDARSSAPTAAPGGPSSPVPFELEGAVFSAKKPVFESTEPGPSATTAPPLDTREAERERRVQRDAPDDLVLELDQGALDSAVAARGRWQRQDTPESVAERGSLELDLGNLGGDNRGRGESVPPLSEPLLRQMVDRYAVGDFSGALVLAEGLLEANPTHPEALRYARNCREVLMQMYAARLGPLDHLVTMCIPSEQIRWLSLDHRAGFLLSLVDGTSSVEEVLDISGMPRLDALRILYSLVEERVISLTPRAG